MIAHININSIINKTDLLAEGVKGNIDILIISETKINDTFPTSHFITSGFVSPFTFELTYNGGGIFKYIRKDIPSKLLKTPYIFDHTECLTMEIKLRKTKWLPICS